MMLLFLCKGVDRAGIEISDQSQSVSLENNVYIIQLTSSYHQLTMSGRLQR